jgi:hypothetical protein
MSRLEGCRADPSLGAEHLRSLRIEEIIDHAGAFTLPSDGRRARTEAFILLVTASAG